MSVIGVPIRSLWVQISEVAGGVQVHVHGTLLDGSNVRLNWNIESDMSVN